jgi:hypothetical protein
MGWYFQNNARFGSYSAADAKAIEEATTSTLIELNAALAVEGSFAINNNVGNGVVGSAKAVLIERFGADEKCISTMQALVAKGISVEVHAGSMFDKTQETCANGDTNSLAVFLLAMGKGSYYQCSQPQGGVSAWSSGWTSSPDSSGTPWTPDWVNALGDKDYWLDWRKEFDYPLGEPIAQAAQAGDMWTRSFASGTHVQWNKSTRRGKISWANGVVQEGKLLKAANINQVAKYKYCANHENGITNSNMRGGYT